MSDNLQKLLADAVARYNALTPEQKADHDKAQRESWARGMAPWPDAKPPRMVNGVLTYDSYYDYCAD